MTDGIHKEGDILQIYFCVIFHETRHHAQVHVTSGTLVHCALSLATKRTQKEEQWVDFAGQCLLWLLLLSLPAVPLLLLPKNNFLTSLAFAPNSNSVSPTRISLMASSSSFIYFFLAIAQDPQSSALFRLLYMTGHSFRNLMPVSINVLYGDSKTDLKLRCDSCIKIPAIRGCPRRYYYIDGCMLHVSTPALQEACLWALL
jgi:hypothetical protein